MKIVKERILWIVVTVVLLGILTLLTFSNSVFARSRPENEEEIIKLPSGREITSSEINMSAIHKYKITDELRIYNQPNIENDPQIINDKTIILLEANEENKNWFFITTEDKYYGWINIFDIKDILIDKYYQDIVDYTDENEIDNSYRLAKYREYQLLKKNKGIKRIGPLLIININGKERNLVDITAKYGFYLNLVQILDSGYFIIHNQAYEGSVNVIYNIYNINQESYAYSLAFISPDNKKYLTCGKAYDSPYIVRIFKKNNNFELIQECDISLNIDESYYKLIKIEWIDKPAGL